MSRFYWRVVVVLFAVAAALEAIYSDNLPAAMWTSAWMVSMLGHMGAIDRLKIAAAPELLEALRDIAAGNMFIDEAREVARAAISKAEGK